MFGRACDINILSNFSLSKLGRGFACFSFQKALFFGEEKLRSCSLFRSFLNGSFFYPQSLPLNFRLYSAAASPQIQTWASAMLR